MHANYLSLVVYRYAEMPKEEKNKISHRYKALEMVKTHFAEAGYNFQTNHWDWVTHYHDTEASAESSVLGNSSFPVCMALKKMCDW